MGRRTRTLSRPSHDHEKTGHDSHSPGGCRRRRLLLLHVGAGRRSRRSSRRRSRRATSRGGPGDGHARGVRTVAGRLPGLGRREGALRRLQLDREEGQIIAELDPSLLQVQVDIQKANIERQQGEIANQEVQLENDTEEPRADAGSCSKSSWSISSSSNRPTAGQDRAGAARRGGEDAADDGSQPEPGQAEPELHGDPVADRRRRRQPPGRRRTDRAVEHERRAVLHARDRPAELKLTAGVDEAEIGKIRRACRCTFTVDTYEGTTFDGHGRRRAPERANTEQRRDLSGLDQGAESRPEAAAGMTATVEHSDRRRRQTSCGSRTRRCASGRPTTCTRRSA